MAGSKPPQVDAALKSLYATGLFQDVQIRQAGGKIYVRVMENAVINRVAFEGNYKAKDEQLQGELQSKPRGTYSRAVVQADVQRIIDIYQRSGRYDVSVVPKIIELPNSRVDLVFEINEGAKTGCAEDRLRRQPRLFGLSAEGRYQDRPDRLAELDQKQRLL